MQRLAETCEAVAGTTKKLEKIAIVADYFNSRTAEEAAISAVFLSGRPFSMYEETTLQVGGSLLWRVVQDLSGKSERELSDSYRRHGDLGAVAGEVLPPQQSSPGLNVLEVAKLFREISPGRRLRTITTASDRRNTAGVTRCGSSRAHVTTSRNHFRSCRMCFPASTRMQSWMEKSWRGVTRKGIPMNRDERCRSVRCNRGWDARKSARR